MRSQETRSGRWSIARRLVSRLTVVLTVLWLVATAVAMAVVNHEVNEVFDSGLQETAQRLLALAVVDFEEADGGESDAETRVVARNLEFAAHEEYLVYQVRDSTGRVLLRSHDAPARGIPAPLERGHAVVGDWRLFTEHHAPADLFIQVGEPLTHRREALYETLGGLAAPIGLLIPVAGLVVFLTVRRSLAPVAEVRAALDARSGADLSPIPSEAMPEELAPIIQDVNLLLARLERGLETERTFAASSAHELRTPVAAALAQTQRLEAELRGGPQAARVAQISTTLRRLADLVEKLLQLGRADGGIALGRDPTDLMPALRLVVEEFSVPGELGDRLRFDDGGRRRLVARMDIDVFGIALRNLLDNAQRHAPPTSEVAVVVDASGAVHVVSAGPAVPRERLTKLTRRFERGSGEASGAGLGLAIVETVLAQSGGRLELRSPADGRCDGFEAVLHLDLAEGVEREPAA